MVYMDLFNGLACAWYLDDRAHAAQKQHSSPLDLYPHRLLHPFWGSCRCNHIMTENASTKVNAVHERESASVDILFHAFGHEHH
jgi:hypothetical protein